MVIKIEATDIRHITRSKFSRSLVHKKKVFFDMASSFQVRIHILSREFGYLLSLNEFREKLRATLIFGKYVKKP